MSILFFAVNKIGLHCDRTQSLFMCSNRGSKSVDFISSKKMALKLQRAFYNLWTNSAISAIVIENNWFEGPFLHEDQLWQGQILQWPTKCAPLFDAFQRHPLFYCFQFRALLSRAGGIPINPRLRACPGTWTALKWPRQRPLAEVVEGCRQEDRPKGDHP